MIHIYNLSQQAENAYGWRDPVYSSGEGRTIAIQNYLDRDDLAPGEYVLGVLSTGKYNEASPVMATEHVTVEAPTQLIVKHHSLKVVKA